MHTPDGFLSSWVCVVTLLLSIGLTAFSIWKARTWMNREKALLMASLAAMIFAFQMLNFSIGNGTSGHLVGAAMVAILLGPEAAVLVLASVLLVQTFVYGDGGVMAIGANILLMGIVAGYVAHFIYRSMKRKYPLLSGILASWASVVAASFAAAILLGISGTVRFSKVVPAMVWTHVFIGIGEGIITGSLLLYFQKTKHSMKQPAGSALRYVALSTLGALAVMSLALPFASSNPDGLEKVALNLGFYEKAVELYSFAPMSGYTLFGQESYLYVLLSGLSGMAMTFMVGLMIAKLAGLSSRT